MSDCFAWCMSDDPGPMQERSQIVVGFPSDAVLLMDLFATAVRGYWAIISQ